MEEILCLQDIRHCYNGRTVLHIDRLAVGRGIITGLAGPNGSGKRTLLKIMSLAETSTTGTVTFNGRPVRPFAREARHRITLLPQQTYMLRRSVADNVAFGLKARGRKKDIRPAVEEALHMVGLDPSIAARQWHELAGGEAQRVALAARLILRPDVLLLDEPTASVDLESGRSIRRAVLRARRDWGATLIIASHHRSWLEGLSDDIVHLFNGRIIDCSFDNVLLGPWERVDENFWATRLADGQVIHVTPPSQRQSSAVIAPHVLVPAEREPAAGEKTLRGVITAVTFDRHRAEPRIHVVCGDQHFVAAFPDRDRIPASCLPGRTITLLYRPEDIGWLQ